MSEAHLDPWLNYGCGDGGGGGGGGGKYMLSGHYQMQGNQHLGWMEQCLAQVGLFVLSLFLQALFGTWTRIVHGTIE